jgi:hypothetical protein
LLIHMFGHLDATGLLEGGKRGAFRAEEAQSAIHVA